MRVTWRSRSNALDFIARTQRVFVVSLPWVCICAMTVAQVRLARSGSCVARHAFRMN